MSVNSLKLTSIIQLLNCQAAIFLLSSVLHDLLMFASNSSLLLFFCDTCQKKKKTWQRLGSLYVDTAVDNQTVILFDVVLLFPCTSLFVFLHLLSIRRQPMALSLDHCFIADRVSIVPSKMVSSFNVY